MIQSRAQFGFRGVTVPLIADLVALMGYNVVATVLMSLGMMMLPPSVVSLPFKLIFFATVDGWRLVAGGLVRSFG